MLDQLIEYLGTTKFRFMACVCIILSCILLIKSPNKDNNKKCSQEKSAEIINKLVEERSRDLSDRMWLSCKDGLVKGCITGSITGGFMGALSGGVIFSITNPLLLYITEQE